MAQGIWARRKAKSNNELRGLRVKQTAMAKGEPISEETLRALDYHKSPTKPTGDVTADNQSADSNG